MPLCGAFLSFSSVFLVSLCVCPVLSPRLPFQYFLTYTKYSHVVPSVDNLLIGLFYQHEVLESRGDPVDGLFSSLTRLEFISLHGAETDPNSVFPSITNCCPSTVLGNNLSFLH